MPWPYLLALETEHVSASGKKTKRFCEKLLTFDHTYDFYCKDIKWSGGGFAPYTFPFGQLYRHQMERRGLRPLHFSLRSTEQTPNGAEGASPPTLLPNATHAKWS